MSGGGFLDWLSGLFANNPQMASAAPIPLGPQQAQAQAPAPMPSPNPITGGFDRSARMDAALAGLSQWGQNLATQYQRRPVGAPIPQVPSVTDAVYRARAIARQDEQDRAYETLVAGMDPQRQQLYRAMGPQAGAALLARPRGGLASQEEHDRLRLPYGSLYHDQNGRPHVVQAPLVAGLTTAAQEAQRYRVVPPGGEVVGPPGGGMPSIPAPVSQMSQPRAPMIPSGAVPFDPNPEGPPGEIIGQVPPSRPLAQARPSGAGGGGGGQLQTIYRSSQPPPGSPERAFDMRYGTQQGEAAAAIHTAAQTAQQRLDEIAQLRTAMEALRAAGGTTGAGTPASQVATRALQALGVDPTTFGLPATAAPGEVVTAVANRLAMTMVGPGGLPANNFSEADRNFLVQSMPNLANRPEANEFLASVMERAAQRQIEMENRWIDARGRGQDYTSFLREWRGYVNANPVISQADRATATQLLSAGTPRQPAPPAPPPPPTAAPPGYGRGQVAPLPPRPAEPAPAPGAAARPPLPSASQISMFSVDQLIALSGRESEMTQAQREAVDRRLRALGY